MLDIDQVSRALCTVRPNRTDDNHLWYLWRRTCRAIAEELNSQDAITSEDIRDFYRRVGFND